MEAHAALTALPEHGRAGGDRRADGASSPAATRSIPGIRSSWPSATPPAIPGATLTVEDGGPPAHSPIAWQGGQLSKVLLELLGRAHWVPHHPERA